MRSFFIIIFAGSLTSMLCVFLTFFALLLYFELTIAGELPCPVSPACTQSSTNDKDGGSGGSGGSSDDGDQDAFTLQSDCKNIICTCSSVISSLHSLRSWRTTKLLVHVGVDTPPFGLSLCDDKVLNCTDNLKEVSYLPLSNQERLRWDSKQEGVVESTQKKEINEHNKR